MNSKLIHVLVAVSIQILVTALITIQSFLGMQTHADATVRMILRKTYAQQVIQLY
jgi:hypothetical protein